MSHYEISMYNKLSYFINTEKTAFPLDLAVIFITTEGIQHQVGGVAKYIRNYIFFLDKMRDFFREKSVNLTLYAAEPALSNYLPSYCESEFETVKKTLERSGGQFYKLINNTNGTAWINPLDNWKALSASAATVALNVAEKHQATLVFYGSTCLAMAQVYIHKQLKVFNADIRTVYLTHDSAFSTFYKEKNEDILSMDYLCSQWTKFTPNAKIGFVSEYMKNLFSENYMVKEEAFIPSRSGVILEEDRYSPLTQEHIISLLEKYKIPLDKKIIFSWGRADGYKRLDLIFAATEYLNEEFFAVAVTNSKFPELSNYISKGSFKGILIENYKSFELINALVSWNNTVAICLLSENEPGAMAPMEAMLLCKRGGGVVITNSGGFYKEIIIDKKNGFLVKNKAKELSEKILELQEITEERKREVQQNSYETILNGYNQKKNYIDTLITAVPQLHRFRTELIQKATEVG